jgi:hypothetical protein
MAIFSQGGKFPNEHIDPVQRVKVTDDIQGEIRLCKRKTLGNKQPQGSALRLFIFNVPGLKPPPLGG